MQHGNSYIFQHVRVRERNSERQLYTPHYGVSITATEPLENINFPQEKTIANSKIVAVSNLSTKITCISCNGHIIIPTSNTEEMAQCVHCNTTLLIDFCKKTTDATITIKDMTNNEVIKLTASETILLEIIGGREINEMKILKSPTLAIQHSCINITGITH